MNDSESLWIERIGLPLLLAFALGVIVMDIVRDAEHGRLVAAACTAQARSQ